MNGITIKNIEHKKGKWEVRALVAGIITYLTFEKKPSEEEIEKEVYKLIGS